MAGEDRQVVVGQFNKCKPDFFLLSSQTTIPTYMQPCRRASSIAGDYQSTCGFCRASQPIRPLLWPFITFFFAYAVFFLLYGSTRHKIEIHCHYRRDLSIHGKIEYATNEHGLVVARSELEIGITNMGVFFLM